MHNGKLCQRGDCRVLRESTVSDWFPQLRPGIGIEPESATALGRVTSDGSGARHRGSGEHVRSIAGGQEGTFCVVPSAGGGVKLEGMGG